MLKVNKVIRVLAIALVVIGIALFAIGRAVGDLLVKMQEEQVPTERTLTLVVNKINEVLPKMISDELRLDASSVSVGASPGITFAYTLVNERKGEQGAKRAVAMAAAPLLKSGCASPTISRLLQQGVRFQYRFLDREGELVDTAALSADDCKAAGSST